MTHAPILPGSKHGLPLGMLLTPWTAKVPVSSISNTVVPPSWTSSTVPCIHTRDTRRVRPLPARITYPSALSAAPRIPAALSWPDRTFTGGERFPSLQLCSSLDIIGRMKLTPDGAAQTGKFVIWFLTARQMCYPEDIDFPLGNRFRPGLFQIKSFSSTSVSM